MLRAYITYCIVAGVLSIMFALFLRDMGVFDTADYIIVPGVIVPEPTTT